jgi:hypothetical protein
MTIPVSRYREWVDSRNAPIERKQIAYAALDAYERLADQTDVPRGDLEPIVVAAKNPYRFVWDIGTVFLVRLAVIHQATRDAISEIMESKNANERSQIVWALQETLPRDYLIHIIRTALNDRSKEARSEAATKADVFCLNELLPELKARLAIEPDKDVQRTIGFSVEMLTTGHILEYDNEGNPRLTVKTKRGCASPYITQKDIDDGRLESIISELRSKDYY